MKRDESLYEQTFFLLKPDSIRRGIVGDIIGRLERAQIHIVAQQMCMVTKDQIKRHFSSDRASVCGLGEKLLRSYAEMGIDPVQLHVHIDPYSVGVDLQASVARYFQSGPVIKMVLAGVNAVARVRDMVGATLPYRAGAGTIRGDFSLGEAVENIAGKACVNMVHCSDSVSEARREIRAWFEEYEILSYPYRPRTSERVHAEQEIYATPDLYR